MTHFLGLKLFDNINFHQYDHSSLDDHIIQLTKCVLEKYMDIRLNHFAKNVVQNEWFRMGNYLISFFFLLIFILTTGLCYSASVGFMLAFPSVLTPAILSPDSDITATPNQASWITASNGVAGAFGFFILSPIFQISGRKLAHISTNLCLFIGWIIFALAQNITALYAARIVQGLSIGGIYINSMIISEYVDPKRRGYFMTLKKVSISSGILICRASSLFWNWRQIAAFSITFPTIAIILTLFWPESPSYLAMKGRFKSSEEAFVWLHGASNMKELDVLLSSQMQKKKDSITEHWYKFLFKKDFVKPFMIVSLITLLLDLCGKYYIVVYVVQIMVELLGDKSLAIYCSLGADVLTSIALISSCFVIRCFKRRTILFSFGIGTVALMFLICLVIVLKVSIIWLTPSLILLHCFIVNIGLIPLSFTLIGEVFPLEYKGSGSCITGVVFTLLYTFSLKITPILMENFGVEGVYGTYGVSIAVCLIALHFLLPETKDKTLQEIEQEFKGLKPTT